MDVNIDRRYILGSVDRALSVLECFDEENYELSVPEIARKLSMAKSNVYRIVYTLWTRGYLLKNEVTHRYRIGYRILTLGAVLRKKSDLIQEVRPYLRRLMEKSGETTHLAILYDGMSTFIEKIEGPKTIKMSSVIGARMPAYCSATGKMLLAGLDDEEFDRYLKSVEFKKLTLHTIVDPKRLKEEVRKIKECGYSVDNEESEEGLMCISAPIRDHNGKIIAAISISGPVTRLKKREEEYIKEIKGIAKEISSAITL